jgi:Zn-dependent M28 family amino/carboxypeptidase
MRNTWLRRVVSFGIVTMVTLAGVGALLAQGGRAPAIETIKQAELRADLFFVSSDAMRGRLTNTPTNLLAADWVRARFERLGLQPGGHNGTFDHRYSLMTAALGDGHGNAVAVESGSGSWSLGLNQDFYPHRFSASGTVQGDVVFAGFGIVSPERSHDDYKNAVAGKIVLILDREPGVNDPASPFDGVVSSEPGQPLKKVLAAQAKGAIGVIFVEDVHNATGPTSFATQASFYWPDTPPRIERYTLMTWAEQIHVPVVQVSPAVARQLVIGQHQSLLDLAKSAETRGGVTPVALPGVKLRLSTAVKRTTVADRSVVAMLEGSDPVLKREYVLISSHLDHDGANGTDAASVMNGADDNGSGTVGLMAIAEAFVQAARAGQRPKRSVIFADWNSEERGLLGAWAYTEDPIVPLDRIVGVLNMDMIGRNEEVPSSGGPRFRGLEPQTAESNANATNILGTVRSPDLRTLFESGNQGLGLDLKFRYDNNPSNLLRRSDHWPFIQHGIPGVWVHTGLHPDYHTVYDDPEKINYPKMEKIARLVYQASWDLANATTRPKLLPVGGVPSQSTR